MTDVTKRSPLVEARQRADDPLHESRGAALSGAPRRVKKVRRGGTVGRDGGSPLVIYHCFYGDLMDFYGDLMDFYGDLMDFYGDLMDVYGDLMDVYGD